MTSRIFKILFIAVSVAAIFSGLCANESRKAKYIFLMIGDGMGSNHRAIASTYLKATTNRKMIMDSFPVKNLTVTDSLSGTTDSAAAGTALACGVKTQNGMLGITPDGKKVNSVAVDAQNAGLKVAIMTDVPINHATPAAFFAHSAKRNLYSEISRCIPESGFDIFTGTSFLVSKGEHSPEKFLSKKGYRIINDFDVFKNLQKGSEKIIFIHDIPYVIDTPASPQITLAGKLSKVIELIKSDTGFFIMVEGGKIDWAAHNNDLATTVKETVAFDDAVKVAYDFYRAHPGETLIVVTADHDTGGLVLTDNTAGAAEVINAQRCSKAELLNNLISLKKSAAPFEQALKIIVENYGLKNLKESNIAQLKQAYDIFLSSNQKTLLPEELKKMYGMQNPVISICSQISDDRAGIKWNTRGHSGTPVTTTAIGIGSEIFSRDMDNTELPGLIKQLLPPHPDN